MALLIKPQIGFTYDCEYCKKPVNGCAELFRLYQSPVSLCCECGKSEFTLYAEGGELFFDFPCSLCGKRHKGKVSAGEVMDGIAELRCPVYSLPACFIGQPKLIEFMDSEDAENELCDLIRSLITPDK